MSCCNRLFNLALKVRSPVPCPARNARSSILLNVPWSINDPIIWSLIRSHRSFTEKQCWNQLVVECWGSLCLLLCSYRVYWVINCLLYNNICTNQYRKFILTLNPLTWKIWWAPNNASRWKVGFRSKRDRERLRIGKNWRVIGFKSLTLSPLTWKIWWAPNNASRWQVGFRSKRERERETKDREKLKGDRLQKFNP